MNLHTASSPADNSLDTTGLRVYAQRMKLTKDADTLYRGKCPFHSDKLSFKVFLDSGLWRFECSSCHTQGDAAEFVSRFDQRLNLSGDNTTELWIRIPMAIWERFAEIGEAMRLYGYLVSWTTAEIPDPDNPGWKLGIVRGGAPQTDEGMADQIGCHRSTVLRHREALLAANLLMETRSQYGHRLVVRGSDKWSAKRQGKASSYAWIDEARSSTPATSEKRPRCRKAATSGASRCSKVARQMSQGCTPDVAGMQRRSSRSATSKRRNPNDAQELRPRKPRKAYRKQKESLSAQNQNRAQTAFFSSTSSAADAAIGQGKHPDVEQHLTEREVKKLTRKIAARCENQYGITFNEKNIGTFHTELAEAPILPDEVWLFAAIEIAYNLKNADDKGYSFNQANSRIPAMLVPAVVGDGTGTETAVDRYYAHKNLPATMARQRAEMQREVAEETAAIEEEDAAGREYEAWQREHPCEQDESGFESSNPTALSRYLLRESLRAGYEEDRVASEKRLEELRAARGAELQVAPAEEEEPDDPALIEQELPVEPEPVAVAEVSQ